MNFNKFGREVSGWVSVEAGGHIGNLDFAIAPDSAIPERRQTNRDLVTNKLLRASQLQCRIAAVAEKVERAEKTPPSDSRGHLLPQRRQARPVTRLDDATRHPVERNLVVRISNKCRIEACQCFHVAVQPKKDRALFGKDLRILGSDGECFIIYGNRRFVAAQGNEGIAMLAVRLYIRWLDGRGLLVLRDRLLHAAQAPQCVAKAIICLVIIGPDRDRFFIIWNRLFKAPDCAKCVCEIPVSFGVVGLDLQRLFVGSDRFLGAIEQMKHVAEIVVSFRIVRTYREGFLVLRHRLFEPVQRLQCVAKIIVGFGKIRPNDDRFFITANGVRKTFKTGEGGSKELMYVSGALVDPDGAPEEMLRVCESVLLQTQQSKLAQGRKMACIAHQHPLIELFSLTNASLIVQQNRLLKHLLKIMEGQRMHCVTSHRLLAREAEELAE